MSSNRSRSRRRTALSAALAVALLAGCFSDPPPPPEVQPLEIIATNSVQPDRFCQLNVPEVGAGPHEVHLISELGPAVVRVLDPDGTVILEETVVPQVFEGDEDPQDLPVGQLPEVPVLRLGAGVHTIECMPDGRTTSTAELRVVPARPGFEDLQPPR